MKTDIGNFHNLPYVILYPDISAPENSETNRFYIINTDLKNEEVTFIKAR
jgi:hypothetical protein